MPEADGRSTITELLTLPLFLLYSISAFAASAVCLLRPLPPPAAAGVHAASAPQLAFVGVVQLTDPATTVTNLLRWLRAGGIAGLFLLAFGTGCDNARTFAGAFAMCAADWQTPSAVAAAAAAAAACCRCCLSLLLLLPLPQPLPPPLLMLMLLMIPLQLPMRLLPPPPPLLLSVLLHVAAVAAAMCLLLTLAVSRYQERAGRGFWTA